VTQQPSIGRIVHYVSFGTPGGEYGHECRAAVITEVAAGDAPDGESQPQSVGLCVLNPTGQFFNRDVGYDNGDATTGCTQLCGSLDYAGGTWHWPERA
jgi:hypothetical protein